MIEAFSAWAYALRTPGGAAKTDRRATRLVLTRRGAALAHEYADASLSEMDDVKDGIERLHAIVSRNQAVNPTATLDRA
jgi:hypothetical protein